MSQVKKGGEQIPEEVTRHVPDTTKCLLWGRAAGRCEFAGCNIALWKSPITQESVNTGQRAHIYSFSKKGPRGNEGIAPNFINDISNLILVCYACHRTIDNHNGVRFSAELLRQWKERHESRIERVTGINPDRRSHVVLYGANISSYSSPLSYALAVEALFPDRYPAEDHAIELGTVNNSITDSDAEYWTIEKAHLIRKFEQRVRERLCDGTIQHLSVFALAPQPLLVLLGTLLTDISAVDVFQLSREPQSWKWRDSVGDLHLLIEEPRRIDGPPALILALSATVSHSRVTSVLGGNPAIWKVTVTQPHNDLLRSRSQLRDLRTQLRHLMDRIKSVHGQQSQLRIFPAVPVSVAVELGRIRQPKADLSWRIYDQVKGLGGFVPAIEIM